MESSHETDPPVRTICVPLLAGDACRAAVLPVAVWTRCIIRVRMMHHRSDVRHDIWPAVLVATTNAGKLPEIAHALEGAPVRLFTLADVPPVPEPEETGAS